MLMEAKQFQRLSLSKKILLLSKEGQYITSRIFLRYQVDLYLFKDYFVEIYRTLAFSDIFSIDVAPKRNVTEAYLDQIDIKELTSFNN